jgi:hypothetical protein
MVAVLRPADQSPRRSIPTLLSGSPGPVRPSAPDAGPALEGRQRPLAKLVEARELRAAERGEAQQRALVPRVARTLLERLEPGEPRVVLTDQVQEGLPDAGVEEVRSLESRADGVRAAVGVPHRGPRCLDPSGALGLLVLDASPGDPLLAPGAGPPDARRALRGLVGESRRLRASGALRGLTLEPSRLDARLAAGPRGRDAAGPIGSLLLSALEPSRLDPPGTSRRLVLLAGGQGAGLRTGTIGACAGAGDQEQDEDEGHAPEHGANTNLARSEHERGEDRGARGLSPAPRASPVHVSADSMALGAAEFSRLHFVRKPLKPAPRPSRTPPAGRRHPPEDLDARTMTTTLTTRTLSPSPAPTAATPLDLPLGAMRLDPRGRVLHHVAPGGARLDAPPPRLAGRSFFEHYLAGTPFAHLAEVYRSGVNRGALYHFVDVGCTSGELTLFLYFHAPTQQGWAFIERRMETGDALRALPGARAAA